MSAGHERPIVALAVTSLLVVALVTTAGAASRAPRTPTRVPRIVKGIGHGHWLPTITRVFPGRIIAWKAISNSHTVTAYGGNWLFNRALPFGATVLRRFTRPGIYRFRCRIHSSLVNGRCVGMCGRIVVL
jgi:plastocyanin